MIAIITILASILIPTMNEVKERARVVVCISNLRQVGVAHIVFAGNNDGQLPWAPGTDSFPSIPCRWGNTRWVDGYSQMREYLDLVWGLYNWKPFQTRTIPQPGKYLTDFRVFYCPGWILHLDNSPGTYYYNNTSLRYVPDRLDKAFMQPMDYPWNFNSQRIGYEIFASGHPRPNDLSNDEKGLECSRRLLSKQRRLRASSLPTCWMAADMASASCHKVPQNVSGFTFPYNVIHVDGHAGTHQVDPYSGASGGTVRMPGGDWQKSSSQMPYGNSGWNPTIGLQRTGLDTDNDRKGR